MNMRPKINKTRLKPVSRPVGGIVGFFQKVIKRDYSQTVLKWCKNSAKIKLYKIIYWIFNYNTIINAFGDTEKINNQL